VRAPVRAGTWERLTRIRRQRRFQYIATVGLVIFGPVLAILTFLVLGPFSNGGNAAALRLVLLADLVYVLGVAALVLQRVAQMVAARRAKSAGSRLHMRLTRVFALFALIPTVLVAIFAAVTVGIGLEGWFSDQVRSVVGSSLAAAEAYETEHREDLIQDARALARFLNASRRSKSFVSDGDIRQMLAQGQAQVRRGLREAYVIDGAGDIRSRGERSYLFDYERPSLAELASARSGEIVIIRDWDVNEFRALIALDDFVDRFLYVTRDVDGNILNLLDETRETVRFYNQLESERGRILFEFGLLYLGFAVVLILAAILLGLWFAERLARPVGRLAAAAQRVGAGDMDVQVVEEEGDDEIAMLGRIFNQMTRQLKGQRNALLANNQQIEDRRRLFDSVLSSVTAGVIGLDETGQVAFVNRSAERLLELSDDQKQNANISTAIPEFAPLFERLIAGGAEIAQEEIRVMRGRKLENLLVRMSTRRDDEGRLEGYVVAFDDVTDLVTAQRMAAWGDVARRIAHEIKNPLTPIQLSAERIKRKYAPLVGDQHKDLEQYTDVIIRQTNDLRRIVDEFSDFARMREPERRDQDLVELVNDAVVLQRNGQPNVKILADIPDRPVPAAIDGTMISQALTNLIKNAGEAIETRIEKAVNLPFDPEIRIHMESDGDQSVITISDNGIGLPEDRARLFEPYVTTRAHGTGLGLPIVKKIIEEHGGTFSLNDAEPFDDAAPHAGARAEIRLPTGQAADARPQAAKTGTV